MKRIFMAHNHYLQPGGEDESFAAEASALERSGHLVSRYALHSRQIDAARQFENALRAVWNHGVYTELAERFRRQRYDVAHFQNKFPVISPSAIHAARTARLPVVQALRNYRLTCVNGLLFREGKDCQRCVGSKVPWRGVWYRCYRSSAAASAAVASMLAVHSALRTYSTNVHLFLVLSAFMMRVFVRSGLPEEKLFVKPNCVYPDPGIGDGRGRYALFVGRLSEEKGLRTLLRAWSRSGGHLPLKVVGTGPLEAFVSNPPHPDVTYLGALGHAAVLDLIGQASVVVVPSEWQEPFGRVVIEAFAKGTPVIASDSGALSEIVEHGRTGLLFASGDAEQLAQRLQWVYEHPDELAKMRIEAREVYATRYAADVNVSLLLEAYDRAHEFARG